jgi:hypothetical protein
MHTETVLSYPKQSNWERAEFKDGKMGKGRTKRIRIGLLAINYYLSQIHVCAQGALVATTSGAACSSGVSSSCLCPVIVSILVSGSMVTCKRTVVI